MYLKEKLPFVDNKENHKPVSFDNLKLWSIYSMQLYNFTLAKIILIIMHFLYLFFNL